MKRLVEWWHEREERRRKEKEEYNKESVIQKASELFQIREHGHLIWFTFDGRLVCPITMFDCDDPVAVIGAMRDLYISEYLGK